MNLQPPSFFQVSPPKGSEAAEKAILRKWREEIARVNRENKLLRQRLEAACGRPVKLPPLTTATSSSPPLHIPSDFVHVEECVLQSRLELLEREKRETAMQVLELEKSLALHKEEFRRNLNALKDQHAEEISKLELEKQRIYSEYQSYREDRERKAEVVSSEKAKLKRKLDEMESDNQEIIRNLEGELTSITEQLSLSREECECLKSDNTAQLRALSAEVTRHSLKVQQLEAYLGGEIPDLAASQRGSTWKEEREILCSELQKNKLKVEKFRSENYLLNVRLKSMSEILSLQEADITKRCSSDSERVRGLLTRWREKVYELLVRRKLHEIEDIEYKEDVRKNETSLAELVEGSEREQRILEHALADKSAQLQLQTTKKEAVEEELSAAKATIALLQGRLQSKFEVCTRAGRSVAAMANIFSGFRSTFNQALTRLANYEHRIVFAIKRMQSLKALFSCRSALMRSRHTAGRADAECQVEEEDSSEQVDLSSLTKQQLELEVQTLSQERDHLIGQLEESTEAFQLQLKSLEDKYLSGDKELESQLEESEAECGALRESLAELQERLTSSEGDRDNLSKMTQQLGRELEQLKASMESRLASDIAKQKQQSQEELCEMEKLLGVARREHSKALVQLQQLTRRMALERERAVQLAEMGRDKVEKELASSRKQLQSTQVERNILRSTLRQDGGGVGLPSTAPGRPHDREGLYGHTQQQGKRSREPSPTPTSRPAGPGLTVTPPSPPLHLYNTHRAGGGSPNSGSKGNSAGSTPQEQEDIRDVLKDLRMLSASLLSLESDSGQHHNQT